MIGFKKFLFSIASLSLTVPVFSNLASCSKVKKNSQSDSVIKFQKDFISMQTGEIKKTLITNYTEIKNKGFLSNELVAVDDPSIVSVPYVNGKINENLTFAGLKKGETKVHVTFVNIINQKQATGTIRVKVVSDVNVVYEKGIAKDRDNPLQFSSDKKQVELGHITDVFWNNLSNLDKSTLSINATNNESENTDINKLIKFDIDKNGHIIATRRDSVNIYKLSTFHIKVTTSKEGIKPNDDGWDFWFKADTVHKDLHVNKIAPFAFKYSSNIMPKPPLNGSVFINISTQDDWNYLTENGKKSKKELNDELNEVAKNITTSEKGDDKLLKKFNFEEVDPSLSNKQFILNFESEDKSFASKSINIPFKFAIGTDSSNGDSNFIACDSQFTIKPFRHGAGIVDDHRDSITPVNELPLDLFQDYFSSHTKTNYFNFKADENLDTLSKNGGLFTRFSFWVEGSNSFKYAEYVETLGNSGYKYDSTVTLTAESFNKLGGGADLNIYTSEEPDEISKFNKKIESISRSQSETDYARSTGVDLYGKITKNRLKLNCLGFKDNGVNKQNLHINGGEYYFLSKFKDAMGNYEVIWSHFKWKEADIQKFNLNIGIEEHLMTMPVSRDEQHHDGGIFEGQDNYNNFSDKDISNGVISKIDNNTVVSPLMLSAKPIKFGLPNDTGNFSDNDKPYRGYIKLNGGYNFIFRYVNFSLESQTDDILDKSSLGLAVPDDDSDDSVYLKFTLKGQANKDIRQGEIKIAVRQRNPSAYSEIVIPYAAYAGEDETAGKIDINNFTFKDADPDFADPTSIYIAKSAKNRAVYLGVSSVKKDNQPELSVANVYVESGYSYEGSEGAISLDFPSSSRVKGDVPKQVGNITFGGDIAVKGSYVINNTYGSGINGFVTFCGDVNFTSTNNYIGTDSNDQDPSQPTSAVIMTGSIRCQDSTSNDQTYLSKFGIRFAGNVNVNGVNKVVGTDRSKERLAVIGMPLHMFTGDITFDKDVTMDYGNTNMREVGVYVYQNLQCDKNISADSQVQYLNMQQISGNLKIKGNDSKTPTKDLYRALVIDMATSNFRVKSFDSPLALTSSVFNIGKEGNETNNIFSIASSYIEHNGERKPNKFVVENDWNSNSEISKSYLEKMPNININAKFINEDDSDKNNVYAISASGRYAPNAEILVISYYDNDNNKLKYEYQWKSNQTFDIPNFLK